MIPNLRRGGIAQQLMPPPARSLQTNFRGVEEPASAYRCCGSSSGLLRLFRHRPARRRLQQARRGVQAALNVRASNGYSPAAN